MNEKLNQLSHKDGARWRRSSRLSRLDFDRREERKTTDRIAVELRDIAPRVRLHSKQPKII